MNTRSAVGLLLFGAACVWGPGVAAARESILTRKLEAALVKPPQDLETCFSPEEPCDVKLLKLLESARTSIELAVYDINLDELVHHLIVKARSIPVRLVVDRRQAKGGRSAVRLLLKEGVKLRFGHQRGLMHNKFVVVDGKMVETGSFNYTHHASVANNENQIYLSNPEVVTRYRRRFEKLWAEGDQ